MQVLTPVRRVVTGTDGAGQSCIVADGPSPAIQTVAARPGYQNANLWRTDVFTDAIHAPDDIEQHRGVLPPNGGTVLRVIDFPPLPQDPEEQRRQMREVFETIYPDAQHQPDSQRHPGMHITATVDYALVLAGEITAIMDTGETVLRAGDVLIQRGTNHAWENRTRQIARVAFVLVDASGVRTAGGA